MEQTIEAAVEHTENSSHLNLPPQRVARSRSDLRNAAIRPDSPGVLLTSSGARFFVRQITESITPNLTVLSHNEIPPENRIVSLGVVT